MPSGSDVRLHHRYLIEYSEPDQITRSDSSLSLVHLSPIFPSKYPSGEQVKPPYAREPMEMKEKSYKSPDKQQVRTKWNIRRYPQLISEKSQEAKRSLKRPNPKLDVDEAYAKRFSARQIRWPSHLIRSFPRSGPFFVSCLAQPMNSTLSSFRKRFSY